ncbi:MAG: transglutaminase-like domain-containing protein [Verrucomicrobiota bacterium]|nr:transglutaminase-like domain-containing protein [Verrucomicrobiota bacterium]
MSIKENRLAGVAAGTLRRLGVTLIILTALLLPSPLNSLSMEELRKMSDLTPRKFAKLFAQFQYRLFEEVQSPEVFLATEMGDCDDYAILAAQILGERGYTPRLIAVRMPGITHVICYIEETESYLDFNNRVYLSRTVGCERDLAKIAKKVAKSFESSWTSASEFTFANGLKQMVVTIARTDEYVGLSDRNKSAAPQTRVPINIGF